MTQAIKSDLSLKTGWVAIPPPEFPEPFSGKVATWYKKHSSEDREGALELMSRSIGLLDMGKTVTSVSLQALSIGEWIAKQYYGLQLNTNASLIIQAVSMPFALLGILFSSIQSVYEGYQLYKAHEIIGKINKLKDIHADPLKFLKNIEKKYFHLSSKDLEKITGQMQTHDLLSPENEEKKWYGLIASTMQVKYEQLSRKISPAFAEKCKDLRQILIDLDDLNKKTQTNAQNKVKELIDMMDTPILEKIERKYIKLSEKDLKNIGKKLQGLSPKEADKKRIELTENALSLKYAQLKRRMTPWCAEKLYKELSQTLSGLKSPDKAVRAQAKLNVKKLIEMMDAQSRKKLVVHAIALTAFLCGIVSLVLTITFPPAAFIILALTLISISLGLTRMLLDKAWLSHQGNYLSFKKKPSSIQPKLKAKPS